MTTTSGTGTAADATITVSRADLTRVLQGDADEARDRLTAAVIGDVGHHVTFHPEGTWSVEHSTLCGPRHDDCEYQAAVRRVIGNGTPAEGRWRITDIDSEGLPSLERVEPEP